MADKRSLQEVYIFVPEGRFIHGKPYTDYKIVLGELVQPTSMMATIVKEIEASPYSGPIRFFVLAPRSNDHVQRGLDALEKL